MIFLKGKKKWKNKPKTKRNRGSLEKCQEKDMDKTSLDYFVIPANKEAITGC